METILKIEEEGFGCNDGFVIITSMRRIRIGIERARQRVRFDYGYFVSENDISDFIGAELTDYSVGDTLLKPIDSVDESIMRESEVMFLNLETSKGVVQFGVYKNNDYDGSFSFLVNYQTSNSEYL